MILDPPPGTETAAGSPWGLRRPWETKKAEEPLTGSAALVSVEVRLSTVRYEAENRPPDSTGRASPAFTIVTTIMGGRLHGNAGGVNSKIKQAYHSGAARRTKRAGAAVPAERRRRMAASTVMSRGTVSSSGKKMSSPR